MDILDDTGVSQLSAIFFLKWTTPLTLISPYFSGVFITTPILGFLFPGRM